MKQIITAIGLLFLFGCNNGKTVTIPVSEYKKLTSDTTYPKIFSVNNKDFEIYLGSDKHEYYMIYTYVGSQAIHYPDCSKCKKDSLLKEEIEVLEAELKSLKE